MNATTNKTLVSFDWAAKKILRDKANFDILEGFLSTLLKQEIKIVSLLESESPAARDDDETDKFNRVDLVVEDQKKGIDCRRDSKQPRSALSTVPALWLGEADRRSPEIGRQL